MVQRKYDAEKIPDLIELRKQLSEANKLRHKYWTQLRAVRNQVGRYIRAHEVSAKDLESWMEQTSEEAKEYLRNEWEAGRDIPNEELKKMWHTCEILWKTSQFKEELRRKMKLRTQDKFFFGPTCDNCGFPLPSGRKRFCSDACGNQQRKREDQRQRRKTSTKEKSEVVSNKVEPERIDGPNPQPGSGKKVRDLNCQRYTECLDKAIHCNWQSFHCERCNLKEI